MVRVPLYDGQVCAEVWIEHSSLLPCSFFHVLPCAPMYMCPASPAHCMWNGSAPLTCCRPCVPHPCASMWWNGSAAPMCPPRAPPHVHPPMCPRVSSQHHCT